MKKSTLTILVSFFALLIMFAAPAYSTDSSILAPLTITGTREAEEARKVPYSVGVIDNKDIRETKPTHPSEIMRRVSGVHVNVTGGEGHMASIRQPITTSPVYLYLEDGIPSRSTGFFNHNALYELNVPQSESIEVIKGSGTSLYGSDAIGGIINVTTPHPPLTPEAEVTLEAGGHGFTRSLLSAGTTKGKNGVRGDLNLTRTDGWRDSTGYDRQSASIKWERTLVSGASIKTTASFSNIDQETAGSSAISAYDYKHNPTVNYTPISFRKVEAARVSIAYEKEEDGSLFSLTPYVRHNKMEILPNWTLSYDPQIYTSANNSVGALVKYRKDLTPLKARVIAGIDLDLSPGYREENRIVATKTGKVFTSYTKAERTYDYDVTFKGASPYVHAEISPSPRLKIEGGLRYDRLSYAYGNNLSVVTAGSRRRPADTSVVYKRLTPKVSATYSIAPEANIYLSYSQGFRAPSESQLFRQGQAVNTIGLDPIKSETFETGIKGNAGKINYELSIYSLRKKDDILSFKNTLNNTTETMNAGETLHKGIEASIEASLAEELSVSLNYSYAKHTFEEWSPKTGVNYNGNEMSAAPRVIAGARGRYAPEILNGGALSLEWERLGSYWMDDENTRRYQGHDLAHLRVNYMALKNVELFAKVENLMDKRYATNSTFSVARGEEFAPGMPRTFYGGVRITL